MKMRRSVIRLVGCPHIPPAASDPFRRRFKRVYELEVKPVEIADVARGERRVMDEADRGDHGVLDADRPSRCSRAARRSLRIERCAGRKFENPVPKLLFQIAKSHSDIVSDPVARRYFSAPVGQFHDHRPAEIKSSCDPGACNHCSTFALWRGLSASEMTFVSRTIIAVIDRRNLRGRPKSRFARLDLIHDFRRTRHPKRAIALECRRASIPRPSSRPDASRCARQRRRLPQQLDSPLSDRLWPRVLRSLGNLALDRLPECP